MYEEEIDYEIWDIMIAGWQAKPDHKPRLCAFMSLLTMNIRWHTKVANYIRNKGFKVTLDRKSCGTARLITIEEK